MQSTGKIVCISTSLIKTVIWNDCSVPTGIFKEPVKGEVTVMVNGIVGDRQADLSVHGGPEKAVYAYPSEHYPYWRSELPERDLPYGMFGENFTSSGFSEDSLCIGDRLRAGTVTLRVTQPRMPCFKLGIKFGDDAIIRKFYRSSRWGFYLAVEKEGQCQSGDELHHLGGDEFKVKVADVIRLLQARQLALDPELSNVLRSNLAQGMKQVLLKRLNQQ